MSSGNATARHLAADHRVAANRRRRIITQYDALSSSPEPMGTDLNAWREKAFLCFDEPGSQVDAIWWDCEPANEASRTPAGEAYKARVDGWRQAGIDWPAVFVEETHRRGLEAFWHHRVNPVGGPDPVKRNHPDWVIRTWWGHGLWNLDAPEVRRFKVDELRELAERYDFDGFQVDYARHVPVLPVGRQWELRESVTEFMRRLREALLAVAARKGRPILLSAKVPRGLDECRRDGFDVETWGREGLVDLLTLGSRSFDVELEAFRRAMGPDVKLYPCLDDHHTSDAYQFPPIEVFRGVAANWWRRGADGVVVFNWYSAPAEAYTVAPDQPGDPRQLMPPASQRQAYHEIGSPETLRGKSKVFPVERRGGYPWAEGAFNRNEYAQLPVKLRYDGTPAVIRLISAEDLADPDAREAVATLHLTVFASEPGDVIETRLNDAPLRNGSADYEWKDPKIFSPAPQPNSGWYGSREPDPEQKLLRLSYAVDRACLRAGENIVTVSVIEQTPHCLRQLQVEKVELCVRYPD